MMSSEVIARIADEAAKRARRAHREPLVFESLHDVDQRWSKIPNLGSLRPKGWELVEYHTVDKYGIDDSGPAMSHDSLKNWIKNHLTDEFTSGWAMIEEGEFQVVIGRFEKARERVAA